MSTILPARNREDRFGHPLIIPQVGARRKRLSIINSLLWLPLLLVMIMSMAGCSESFTEAILGAGTAETISPQATTPDATAPDATAPQATTPDATAPQATAPDEAVPDEAEPDEAVPDEAEPDEAVPDEAVPDLKELHDPRIFTRTALEHIFIGSINVRGVASGYHSEAYPHALGEVIAGTRSDPDMDGVYEAKVRVDGVAKTGNRGYSSFYPMEMTVPEAVQAIRDAYENRVFVNGNTWRGEGGGLSILMYLDDEDRIISAFPEYGG